MKPGFFILLLFFAGFDVSGQVRSTLEASVDSLYYRMMQLEQAPIGQYNSLSIFHSDLGSSIIEQSSPPFTVLDSLFQLIQLNALNISQARTSYAMLIEENRIKNEIHSDKPVDDSVSELISAGTEKMKIILSALANFSIAKEKYDLLLKNNGVKRINTLSFADTLGGNLSVLSDSLEILSAVLIATKKHHEQYYGVTRNELFWKDYNKISEMESILKNFRQALLQLENSQSRFYSANPDDYFFTGKFTRPRLDIMTSVDQVVQLKLLISDFRTMQRSFHDHLGVTE